MAIGDQGADQLTLFRSAVRLACRELRGGVRGFRIFLACLVLGVTAIAGIGSLGASVTAGLRADGAALLGGDVAVRVLYHPATAEERRFLEQSGAVSEVVTMRAMARSSDNAKQSLAELKAVDATYPLYGALSLDPARPLAETLAERGGMFGAAVDPAVASRLGLATGDRFRVGDAVFELRALIAHEPDASLTGLAFGPRITIAAAALPQTGLIHPGALVGYEYRLKLPAGTDAAAWTEAARAAFPDAGWQIRTADRAAPSLQRLIDRIAFFLDLAGITALLVGGIGIGNAVAGYVQSKTGTIATLKCLGAPNRLVFAAYLAQVLALALVGIVVALVLGALLPAAAVPLIARLFPVAPRLGIYPLPLAEAALAGLLATLAFSLWPLAAIGRVAPGALFRDTVAPARRRPPLAAIAATAMAAAGLAALIVLAAPDRIVALWYIAGAVAAFAVFRGAGALIVRAARRLGRSRWIAARPLIRLALANLHRPGAPTARIVLSLGIGLSVLAAVALVEGNLADEIDTRLADRAPSYFFIDIQPDQLAGFEALVGATAGASLQQVPMLRGRITRLNGAAVETAAVAPDARWALRSDRGLTYAATPPAGARIVAGKWWPQGYNGPPLVSFDAELAHGMGLKVGDTLTVNLLGREITATIANLRQIDWARLGINFAIVFAPGTLEAAPQTHLAAVYLPQSEEEPLVRRVVAQYPNVTAIPVREALATVANIVGAIGTAIRLVAAVALAAGLLVLGGAVAAGHRRRVYDAVVLKVLGATRPMLAASFLAEYGLLAVATALVAAGIGTAAAWALVTRALHMDFVFFPAPLLWLFVLAMPATAALGFVGTWRALGSQPAAVLRYE